MSRPTRRELLKTAGVLATGLAAGACRESESAARPAAAGRRPNFLFFFPDQHRWDWTPLTSGLPVPMPNLHSLAQRGTTVERAFCASPVCAPSRACLATGREYDHCGVVANGENLPLDRPTIYRLLRDVGYHVLGCGKLDLGQSEILSPGGMGLDGRRLIREWGFSDGINNAGKGGGANAYLLDPVGPRDSYYAYLDGQPEPLGRICADDMMRRRSPTKAYQWGDTRPSPLDEEHYCDNWIARNGLALLDRVPPGEPWFVMVNFAGPHPPMDIPVQLERTYRGPDRVIDDFPQPHRYEGPWDGAHQVRIRQNYTAMVENIDRWLGIYLQQLEERGELENTVVVYSSDHGEMLGDRGRWGKKLPYEASVGVPLVLAGPGIRNDHRSTALVSLIDLAVTFLDLGGAERPEEMDGVSLRALLAGRTDRHRDYVFSGLGDWRMVFDGRHKLITNLEGVERRLHDLLEDPWEDVDLAAADPARCRELLDLMRQGRAPAVPATGA